MEINVGDYIITHDNDVYVIINKSVTDSGGTSYDLKATKQTPVVISDYGDCFYEYKTVRAIGRNTLRHMGQIIPGNEITPALRILYMS